MNKTIIGILRHVQEDELLPVLVAYAASGFSKVEITMNSHNAAALIEEAAKQFAGSLQVGAGTVCSLRDLDRALEAGASFIVTPIVQEEVIRACVRQNIPVYPGAYTPTEIHRAWSMGAAMVKLFPATALGPAYIRDVKASLDAIKILPVGGIGLHNIDAFTTAGADGFGIGSTLFDRNLIQQKNFTALKIHFETFAGKLLPQSNYTHETRNT